MLRKVPPKVLQNVIVRRGNFSGANRKVVTKRREARARRSNFRVDRTVQDAMTTNYRGYQRDDVA